MKKYLIKLKYTGGVSKDYHWYMMAEAKSPEQAKVKARKQIDAFYSQSMHVPIIDGVEAVDGKRQEQLETEAAALRMKLGELERELKCTRAKFDDTERRLIAFKKFTEAAQDCCSAR